MNAQVPGRARFIYKQRRRYAMMSKTPITIRQARIDEYDAVKGFYCDLIDSMQDAEFKPAWIFGVYPTEKFLRDSLKEQNLIIAFLDDRLVGAMILNHESESEYDSVKWKVNAKKEEVMVIHALGISADCQRKGLARQLVLYAIAIGIKNSIKAIRLDVLKINVPAAKLYISMGFQYIDTIELYYEDTGLTEFYVYELGL